MEQRDFWIEVFAFRGSVTPLVMSRGIFFGAFATLVWVGSAHLSLDTGLGVAPYEIIGAVLALLLVLRTNAGYDRWYEGRKLWGGIVNQCRNLAVIGMAYGPRDSIWREQFVRWTAAFSHACRHSLRGERNLFDMEDLLGEHDARALANAPHLPLAVTLRISELLQTAVKRGGIDRFAFLQAERERSLLIDYIGSCERIQKTPLARVFSIKIRRFLFFYLMALPFGIVDKSGALTPLLSMLVAYPLLSLDQIGVELQNPFHTKRLGHLPLGDICRTIEANLLAMLEHGPDVTAEESQMLAQGSLEEVACEVTPAFAIEAGPLEFTGAAADGHTESRTSARAI